MHNICLDSSSPTNGTKVAKFSINRVLNIKKMDDRPENHLPRSVASAYYPMNFKNYNSQRKKLILPEYGRHIHDMVADLRLIKDRDLRTRQAYAVIAVMGNLNTHLRDTADFRHKLWDHLFIMAGFDLDVDSPYPIPSEEALAYHPAKLGYPRRDFAHKQYGRNIRGIIDAVVKIEDRQERDAIAVDIAKFMKVKSFEYNDEYPSNEVIIADMERFSKGALHLDEDILNGTKLYKQTKPQPKGGKKRPQQNNNNKKAGYRNNNQKKR